MTSRELWEPISKSVKNIKTAISLGARDVLGSIAYALQITFTIDESKINRIKSDRKNTLERLGREYSSLWSSIIASNPDFSTLALITAPGPYLACYLALNSRADVGGIQDFFEAAGLGGKWLENALSVSPSKGSDENRNERVKSMLARSTSSVHASEIEAEIRRAVKNLEKVFQIRTERLMENEKEESSVGVSSEMRKNLSEKLASSSKIKKALQLKFNTSKVLEETQEYGDRIISSLEANRKFIKMINECKSPNELKKAYEYLLENSLFRIKGLDPKNYLKKIDSAVETSYSAISKNTLDVEKNKDIEHVLSISGARKEEYESLRTELEREEFLKACILKIQSMKEKENIIKTMQKKDYKDAVEVICKEFKESLLGDISEEIFEKMASDFPDDEGVKTLKKYIDKLNQISLPS